MSDVVSVSEARRRRRHRAGRARPVRRVRLLLETHTLLRWVEGDELSSTSTHAPVSPPRGART